MTPDRWRRIGELFDAALRVDEPREWLAGACGGDLELGSEVAELIASDLAARQGLIQSRVKSAVASLFGETNPRKIGSYRVIRQIGRGGMGTVFLAWREDDPLQTEVAVKLIRPALTTETNLHRFRREGEVLKQLRHPNIATLLDSAVTPRGVPYLVLEYVDGEKITDYCRSHGLDVADRLRLFLQVCSALEHAHAQHIVHRDLKPANILVDRAGTAKLLDFGICKPLDPSPVASDSLTVTGALPMLTPDYASPEQLRGDHVTIASDVYSTGAVLHEMLTECYPDGSAGARQLPGLDAILLHALEPELSRRFPSVVQFADEVRRQLEDGPAAARPANGGRSLTNLLRIAHWGTEGIRE